MIPALLGIAVLLIATVLIRAPFTKRTIILLVLGSLLIVLVVRFSVPVTATTRILLHLLHIPF